MRSGSGRARSHTCPSTRAATAALARPGPIALARSAAVAPAGNRFSLPSGSVTRISDATIGSVRGLVGRRGRGGGGERRQGARVPEVLLSGKRNQHADRDPPDHAARGQNVRFVGHMGDILVGRRRQGHGRVVEDGGGWWRPRRCNLHHPPPTSTILPIIRNAAARVRPPTPVRPARRRGAAVPALARPRRVHGPRRLGARAVRDRHAPAQHHGDPAHGPGPPQPDPGRGDPLPTQARPPCPPALSNEEAESKDPEGKLYYIRSPVEGGPQPFLTVATTRPETLLGDTAVAVTPKDARHAGFVGKVARLPIADISIPIVADEAVDPAFGTGFLKVTPAHDATDFDIGLRHKLEIALVMNQDARMDHATRVPKGLAGLDRFEARERIVDMLKERRLLEKIEPHRHALRRCYRCDTIVEPRLSDQWFVKMQPLAEPVLADYRRSAFRLIPERWRATFEHWMEHIRDWNISRQLWWGHRIPVFSCTKCKHQWADRQDPTTCPRCGGAVEQDPDVLDTWFSSWLWPFATFGWPEPTPDLARFYPGHTLVTAPEILFFWVARMLMSGYHFMGAKPFATLCLHSTVRDTQHRKMSKSLGNGIDPLDVVRLYGADALRWTLIAGSSLGADVILDPDDLETTFAPGRNFANKLWNIGRFILAQLPQRVQPIDALEPQRLPLADRWILSRLQATIREATASFEQFRLDEGAKRCFDFAWKELADWYGEAG